MGYDGFISYSHAADDQLAPALQSGLQRLARPWWRMRALNVFRDATGLSVNPHLWASIESALDDTEWFVLLASPGAAASEWVTREVAHWLATKPANRILPVVTDGVWEWDPARGDFTAESTAVPSVLRGVYRDEPRHLDLRWAHDEQHLDLRHSRFRDAVADLAAPMHGVSKDELEGEDVRRHRRAMVLARAAVVTLATLFALSGVATAMAVRNARSADRALRVARSEQGIAMQERDLAQGSARQAARARDLAQAASQREAKQRRRAETSAALAQRETKRADANASEAQHNALAATLNAAAATNNAAVAQRNAAAAQQFADEAAANAQAAIASANTAQHMARIARSKALAIASRDAVLAGQPDLGMLLAVEAERADDNADSRAALVGAPPHLRGVLQGMNTATQVVISANGAVAVAADDGGTVKVWNLHDLQPLATPPPGALLASNRSVVPALSSDGTALAYTDSQHVLLWDTRLSRVRWVVSATDVGRVLFDPSGQVLIAVRASEIDALDARTGQRLWSTPGGRTSAVGFDPHSGAVIVGTSTDTQFHDLRHGTVTRSLGLGSAAIGFDPSGAKAVTVTVTCATTCVAHNSEVLVTSKLWDTATWTSATGPVQIATATPLTIDQLSVPHVALVRESTPGTTLGHWHVVFDTNNGPGDYGAQLQDADASTGIGNTLTAAGSRMIAMSVGASTYADAVRTPDGAVVLHNDLQLPLPDSFGAAIDVLPTGRVGSTDPISAAFNGDLVVIATPGSPVEVWDLAHVTQAQSTHTIGVPPGSRAAISADGSTAATATSSTVDIRSTQASRTSISASHSFAMPVDELALDGTGQHAVVAGRSFGGPAEIAWWDIDTGRTVTLTPGCGSLSSASIAADGGAIAFVCDGHVDVWLAEIAATTTLDLPFHASAIAGVANGGASVAITSGGPGASSVWVVQTVTSHVELRLPSGPTSVALAPDGATVAVFSGHSVDVYDVASGALRGRLTVASDHTNPALSFSADGTTLIDRFTTTNCPGGGAGYELSTLSTLDSFGRTLCATSQPSSGVGLSADGMLVGIDVTQGLQPAFEITTFDLRPQSWIPIACGIANRDMTALEWAQYMGNTPYARTCG